LPVKAEAFLWAWQFEYPNGKQSGSVLYVPVGKPVKLLLSSRDVIHAFHIPDAKTMEDAVPGRVTQMWFQFNETGDYRAFCREYCGTAHSYMLATIRVVPVEEFDAWLNTST
jgi:cytochrome c oxidase subunit 2